MALGTTGAASVPVAGAEVPVAGFPNSCRLLVLGM
jgi:hypothetical protein